MPPVPAGLCETCRHAAIVQSDRGSTFYRCELSKTDPRFPKYPPLPILKCVGYVLQDPTASVPENPTAEKS